MVDPQLFPDGVELEGRGAVVIEDGQPYFVGAGIEPPNGLPNCAVALTGSTAKSLLQQVDPTAPWVAVRGKWQGGAIALAEVDFLAASPGAEGYDEVSAPPCSPPKGGWHGHADPRRGLTEQERELRESGVILAKRSVELDDGTHVLVFLAADHAAATAALGRMYEPNSICVVEARWTADTKLSAMRSLLDESAPWSDIVVGFGERFDAEGQIHIVAAVLTVTDELERWLLELPSGLVQLQSSLRELAPTGV